MKITKSTLKQIIKEEVVKLLVEQDEYEEEEEERTDAQKIIRFLSSNDPDTFAQGLEIYSLLKDEIEASDPAGNDQILKKPRVIEQFANSEIENVDFLSGLSALNVTKIINLSGCYSLENVNGLQGLTNLTTLDLSECESLQNVDGLKECTNLKTLSLIDCKSLENVDGLQGLTNLETLVLSGRSSLPRKLQQWFESDSSGTAYEKFIKALNASKTSQP